MNTNLHKFTSKDYNLRLVIFWNINKPMQNRLLSLDVFRGITVAAMILVNNPGDWGHVYSPLLHAHWHGCTPTDLIFPTFLFIVGVSITFALDGREVPILKLFKRSLILFGLGFFLNLYPKFNFETVRVMGVLQRIGIVFFICSVIFIKTNLKTQVYIIFILLTSYTILLTYIPVPYFGSPNLEPTTNLGAWFDRLVFSEAHLWKGAGGKFDPEGLFSTIPAIATGLLGVISGKLLRSSQPVSERIAWLFSIGNLLVIGGLIFDLFFPINKSLWTSSYVLYAGGWAMVGLALCYWLIDIKGYKRFTKPAIVFGTNAITVFFLSGIIPRTLNLFKVATPDGTLISSQKYLQDTYIASWFSNQYSASLAGALTFLGIWTLILWFMYDKKIFIKV